MRAILFFGVLFFSSPNLWAQQFEKKFQLMLPDSIGEHDVEWTDLDNDGVLDIIITGIASKGKFFLLTYKSDTLQGLSWKTAVNTKFTNAAHLLADVDLDNDIDILISGTMEGEDTTQLFTNNQDFTFTQQPFIGTSGTTLHMADFDRDGKAELMISGAKSGKSFLTIYKKKAQGWMQVHDSIKVNTSSLEVFDFDKDGDNDFFVSGRKTDNTTLNTVFFNHGNFYFKPLLINPSVDGTATLGDLNHDGNFDILVAGKDATGKNATTLLLNQGKSFAVKDSLLTTLEDNKVFVADFNSNGKCDIHFIGTNSNGNLVNTILNDKGVFSALPTAGLGAQAFGDFDRDGDLDVIQSITTPTGHALVISLNTTSLKNKPPGKPSSPLAATVFNRLLLFWEKPIDDHTPTASLTYDVALQTSFEEWIAPEFDMILSKRLVVSRGNNGNKNYALLRFPSSQGVSFTVQSVDNAFHAGAGGICKGSRGCQELKLVTQEVCINEQVAFSASKSALWFSFADGFLGRSTTLNYQPSKGDTIFSVIPPTGGSCISIDVYAIKAPDVLVKKTEELKYVCEGQQIRFGVEPGWKQVEWRSSLKGILGQGDSIMFSTLKDDTVKVKISNGTTCFLQRNTAVKISKPELTLDGETYQIVKGEHVALNAHGEGTFLWSPAAGLDQENISNPVASPVRTTEYVVTLTDSLGCTASTRVSVMVETTAFVPNLFTPNEDGRNDEVRIYGLNPVKHFSFTIHNREGSLVYETQDSNEATGMGWNGTYKGTLQPSGVYYWKVKGELASGRKLLLNGKTSGSIVLIR